MAATMRPGGG